MLGQRFDAVDITVVDVETTGLDPLVGDRICEIGAIKWRGGIEVGRFHAMINPGCPIPAEASQIHGITDEMVRDAPSSGEVLGEFVAFANDSLFAAYNAPFDYAFIRNELTVSGIPEPQWTVVDVLAMARHLLPGLTNHRLVTVASAMELSEGQTHRALDDVILTGRAMNMFLGRLKGRDVVGVDDLVRLTEESGNDSRR